MDIKTCIRLFIPETPQRLINSIINIRLQLKSSKDVSTSRRDHVAYWTDKAVSLSPSELLQLTTLLISYIGNCVRFLVPLLEVVPPVLNDIDMGNTKPI